MLLIFLVSTNVGSSSSTSRFLVPFLNWLLGDPSPELIQTARVLIRKCGHLFEYAVLAILCCRALNPEQWLQKWQFGLARRAALIAVVYAATDEFHQSFEPSRTGSPVDVLIDTCGAIGGLTLLYGLIRLRQRRQKM